MKRFPHATGTVGSLLLGNALVVLLGLPAAQAAEYHRVNNPTDLKNRTSALLPGDTLVEEVPGQQRRRTGQVRGRL